MGWWGRIGAGVGAVAGGAVMVLLAPVEIAIAAGAVGAVAVVGAVGYAIGDSGREDAEKRAEAEKLAHAKTAEEAKRARKNFDRLKEALEPRLRTEVAMLAIFGVLRAALAAVGATDDNTLDSAQAICFGDFLPDANADLFRRASAIRSKATGIPGGGNGAGEV